MMDSDEITSPEDAEKAEIGIRDREDAAYWRGLEEGRPRWIPVSERLPEAGVEVLVSKDRVAEIALLDGTFDDEARWSLLTGETVTSEVTHWMPLPEPPKP